MPKSFISKMDKRVIFHSGEQHRFLLKAIKKLNFSWPQFANKIGVHPRSMNDWEREKYSLPLGVFKKVLRMGYFHLIGTNNPHHKKRFKSFLEGSGAVVPSGLENR